MISNKEYNKLCSKKFINEFYKGSFKNFFTALYDDNEISEEDLNELREMLKEFDMNSLVIALMGASPETNRLCEKLFPDVDFEMMRNNIGRVKLETVEEMQNQIIAMVNLRSADREI